MPPPKTDRNCGARSAIATCSHTSHAGLLPVRGPNPDAIRAHPPPPSPRCDPYLSAMANPDHFRILQRGIKAWTLWREENPDTKPDLSQADHTHAYLSRANLSNTNLRGATFLAANLLGAVPKNSTGS